MISARRLTVLTRRSVAKFHGPYAFGLAVSLGLGLGALFGAVGTRSVGRRASTLTRARSVRAAAELDRELGELRRALSLLAQTPAVTASRRGKGDPFEAFRRLYPEFERVGYAPPRPDRLLLDLVSEGPRRRVFGTIRADWAIASLNVPDAQRGEERAIVTSLMALEPGTPLTLGKSRVVRWSDGRTYLASAHRLANLRQTAGDLFVLCGVPTATLAAYERRAEWTCLAFGLFLGLFAGATAWVGIARSTRRLRALNVTLRTRVAARTAELAAAEGSFRAIFEHVPIGLYQCDPEGRFLRVNPFFAQTLGFDGPDAAIEGLVSLRSVGDREARNRFFERLADEGEAREASAAVSRADGGTVWLSERARAVRGASGEVLMIEGTMHDVTAQRELESRLRQMGETDPLTGLLNRRGLTEAIGAAALPVSFVTLDIDLFKAYNDRFGHPAGDLALQAVANTIRGNVRESDGAARAGGEEFVVVLPSTGTAGARRVAETLRAAVEACVGLEAWLTVSAGVATAATADEVDGAFVAADRALYMAKAAGRNRVVVNAAKMA